MSNVQDFLRIDMAFKRLFMFVCYFVMITHVVACIWLIIGSLDAGDEESWMAGGVDEMSASDKYLTSFYFTITTITTVGYGDISASTFTEKIVCIVMMFVGVMAFSFASGSLTNYI